jgi:hypothetical protein
MYRHQMTWFKEVWTKQHTYTVVHAITSSIMTRHLLNQTAVGVHGVTYTVNTVCHKSLALVTCGQFSSVIIHHLLLQAVGILYVSYWTTHVSHADFHHKQILLKILTLFTRSYLMTRSWCAAIARRIIGFHFPSWQS